MACANVFLTIAAIVTFVFGVWPGLGGAATPWIIGIASLAIIAAAWTGVDCRWCGQTIGAAARPAKPAKARKRFT